MNNRQVEWADVEERAREWAGIILQEETGRDREGNLVDVDKYARTLRRRELEAWFDQVGYCELSQFIEMAYDDQADALKDRKKCKLLKPLPELTEHDGEAETHFFRVSQVTAEAIRQSLSVSACQYADTGMISVSALVEDDRWNGFDWMHDEFLSAGLDPLDYGL